jgi:hypothetical protein
VSEFGLDAIVLDEGGIFYYSTGNVYVGRSAFNRRFVGILARLLVASLNAIELGNVGRERERGRGRGQCIIRIVLLPK